MRRLLALVLLVVAGLVGLGSSPAAACEPVQYVADSCVRPAIKVDGERHVVRGHRPDLTIRAVWFGGMTIRGTVTVTFVHRASGRATAPVTRTLRASEARVRGPRLARVGPYRVLVEFEPANDDSQWLPTSGRSTLRVTRR